MYPTIDLNALLIILILLIIVLLFLGL